ncbi:dihydrolipoyl dehydrogenase [Deltaproteobacteria bacterium PRO3]|nr:dihydrolipoyl dehydrogenase [Deltaproteobacteria bacterium PRO3]
MASEISYDLIVIGAGPGGYVAAIRAAQLGMKVACVEKDRTLGGTCLNVGCIPSKALLESSELYVQAKDKLKDHGVQLSGLSLDLKKCMERKDQVVAQLTGGVASLFKKNKIDHVLGQAQLNADRSVTVRQSKEETTLRAKHVILATGSSPIEIPGVAVDGRSVVDSTGALALSQVPKKLIVIGGGYIGLELGSVYLRWGSQVTVLEALDRIVPAMDLEVGKAFQRILQKQGMQFQLSTKVKGATVKKDGTVDVTVEDASGKAATLNADVVLVAVGRKPNTEGLGLDKAGVKVDERGRIAVDGKFQTSLPGVYAIGDVIAGPMLAHKAMEEGVAVVENLAGQAGHVNYDAIPSVVYTWPEVASVGLTEEQLKEKGVEYKAFKFPLMAVGKAIAMGEKEGWVKLLADKKTDRLLGAHILGARASDLIAELVLAIEFKASAEDVARTCHAHPTLSEGVKEAALGLGSGTIHA